MERVSGFSGQGFVTHELDSVSVYGLAPSGRKVSIVGLSLTYQRRELGRIMLFAERLSSLAVPRHSRSSNRTRGS